MSASDTSRQVSAVVDVSGSSGYRQADQTAFKCSLSGVFSRSAYLRYEDRLVGFGVDSLYSGYDGSRER